MRLSRPLLLGAVATGAAICLSSAGAAGPKLLRYSPIFAVLSGGNEIDSSGHAQAGDLDGRGDAPRARERQGLLHHRRHAHRHPSCSACARGPSRGERPRHHPAEGARDR